MNSRKKISLFVGCLAAVAALLLSASLLRGYGHTTRIVVGPYKQAAFILLGLIAAAAVGFCFRPFSKRSLCGTMGIALGVLWFTARMLMAYRTPDANILSLMDRWMPIPLMLMGIGIGLWVGEFIPERISRSSLSKKTAVILALVLMAICLGPALNGGFSWDDAFFSVEAQSMRVSGASIFQRVWQEIVEYVRIGRINPFATFHLLVFYFIPDARWYKLLLVLLTLLNGWLFYRFLRTWAKDAKYSITALLFTVLCFQLRLYHDPLNSYYGLMQVMFCELMISLTGFVRWMRSGKKSRLNLSLLLFLMGLMSYEMFFPLTALFLWLGWCEEKKFQSTLRKVFPYVGLAVVMFALSMLLRMNITEETAYNGTTFGLDPAAVLRTFFAQVTAAFPLSYRVAGEDAAIFGNLIQWKTIFNTSFANFLANIQWQDGIACFLFVFVLCCVPENKRKPSWAGFGLGLLMWLLPGLVISLSWKYQQELRPGLAYIPVYFSYFGAAVLLTEAASLIGKLWRRETVNAILSGVGCVILLLTLQDNRQISAMLNDIFLYPRETGEAALQAGILEDIADGDSLILSAVPYSLWEHGWQFEPYQSQFYSLNTGHMVQAMSVRDYVEQNRDQDAVWLSPPNTVLINYQGDAAAGFAAAGRLRGTGIDPESGSLNYPMVTDVFCYVSGSGLSAATLIYETRDEEVVWLPLADAWKIRETDAGILYKIQENRPILFDTIGVIVY